MAPPPIQILPNAGPGSAPPAPVQVAANGAGGSAPAAPVQVAANGAGGSAPAAPVQVAANAGAGSAPSAPPTVAGSGGSLGPGVIITGALVPNVTGYLPLVAVDAQGIRTYASGPGEIPASSAWLELKRVGERWVLNSYPTGSTGPREAWRSGATGDATPDLTSGWEEDPNSDGAVSGTPIITVIDVADPPANAIGWAQQLIVTGLLPISVAPGTVEIPALLRAAVLVDGSPFWSETGLYLGEFQPAEESYCVRGGSWFLRHGPSGATWFSTADVPTPDLVPPGAYHATTNPHAWQPQAGTPALPASPILYVDRLPPPQVASNLSAGNSPASPLQIVSNGSASAPAAPVQIAANGSAGSAPTAPPVVQA